MIAIIDYGVGNLFSLKSSFDAIGAETVVTGNSEIIRKANKIVLPGVGAFRDARVKLGENGLDRLVCNLAKEGKSVLGICLGMQLLFERSFEYGEYKGLGLLKGEIIPIADRIPSELKVPHMGWNALRLCKEKSPLFQYINNGDYVYFVHSYFAVGCEDSVIATAEYGADITAAVGLKNIFGCQFHPEKSGTVGLNILRAFCQMEDVTG